MILAIRPYGSSFVAIPGPGPVIEARRCLAARSQSATRSSWKCWPARATRGTSMTSVDCLRVRPSCRWHPGTTKRLRPCFDSAAGKGEPSQSWLIASSAPLPATMMQPFSTAMETCRPCAPYGPENRGRQTGSCIRQLSGKRSDARELVLATPQTRHPVSKAARPDGTSV